MAQFLFTSLEKRSDGEFDAMIRMDSKKSKGFTLIEIAIVMVVIGLLTGGGISIMRVMTERKARNDNLEYLQRAKEAILSFAEINGRLPRPDSFASNDGWEDAFAANQNCIGFLPYKNLNIAPTDAYQRRVKYEINNIPATANLITDRGKTCITLSGWNPASGIRPLVVDIGSATSFAVAAILISGGPTDADSAGGEFDACAAVAPEGGGNNITGTPNYIRHVPTATFDDVVVYIGGYELSSKIACLVAKENQEYLQQAREAILGYALINGGLPWPDPNKNGTGIGVPCPPGQPCVGYLPFADLNIGPLDAYQRSVKYEINNSPNPGSLGPNKAITCSTLSAASWPPPLMTRPGLIDSGGGAVQTVAAILISAGPRNADGAVDEFDATGSGSNNTGTPYYIKSPTTNTFDDVVVTIGGPELLSKMVAGGMCP
jgi:prepilin-type N-terminal cleavage/methylation domain-containing protein